MQAIVINWQYGNNVQLESVLDKTILENPTREMPIPTQLAVMYEEIMLREVR